MKKSKQVRGDIKICMTCGSTKDLLRCKSTLPRYECEKCRGSLTGGIKVISNESVPKDTIIFDLNDE